MNSKYFFQFNYSHYGVLITIAFILITGARKHSSRDASSVQIPTAEQQVAETGTNPAPWTPEEQKLLEQALRTYPASTPERWEKISGVLPARSKKDCMKRYKV